MSCCHGNNSLRSSSSLFPWSSSCGPAQEQLYPCNRKCQPFLTWCTKSQVIRWREVIYRQQMWLSPAPTPPQGTGSFLLQSSVSPELKWILELSHWHRSALLYTRGRKLHKGKKNTLSNRQRDLNRTGENLTDPIMAVPRLLQLLLHPDLQGHATTCKHHHFLPSHLLSLGNERAKQMETETSMAAFQQYLFKTSHSEDLPQTTSSAAYLLYKFSSCCLFSLNFTFR